MRVHVVSQQRGGESAAVSTREHLLSTVQQQQQLLRPMAGHTNARQQQMSVDVEHHNNKVMHALRVAMAPSSFPMLVSMVAARLPR